MVSGFEFNDGPWHHVPGYLQEIDNFYEELNHKLTPAQIAADKIVQQRGWTPTFSLIKDTLVPTIQELDIRYIPKQMKLGPGVFFPIYDHERRPLHARLNPFYELESLNGLMKYAMVGKDKDHRNHSLFGQSLQCITNMIKYRSVLFVEGYYDLLAARLLHPEAAVLSTGQKSINDKQIWFCRMAGIERVLVLFDRDEKNAGKKGAGAGRDATRQLIARMPKDHPGIEFVDCGYAIGADDPSDCLKDRLVAERFQQSLKMWFPVKSEIPEEPIGS